MRVDGSLVRYYRYAAGLSQDALAERTGLTRMTVLRIEKGRSVSIQTVKIVATALGCQIADLHPVREAVAGG